MILKILAILAITLPIANTALAAEKCDRYPCYVIKSAPAGHDELMLVHGKRVNSNGTFYWKEEWIASAPNIIRGSDGRFEVGKHIFICDQAGRCSRK